MHKYLKYIFIVLSLNVSGQRQGYNKQVAATFDLLNGREFVLPPMEDVSGRIFNQQTLSGKTIFVDFWFTSCPPCLAEIPFANALESFFAKDTNVVFLKICIENVEKKDVWKTMVTERQIGGMNLFYARNRPQQINLLRAYSVDDFPTYLLVNNNKIIGYRAPRPSQSGWVHWAIYQGRNNQALSESYRQMAMNDKRKVAFEQLNGPQIDSLLKR